MSGLAFTQVSFSYGQTPCIRLFSVQLAKGQLVGLIGANGSGKSTLLRLGAGLLRADQGQVTLDGKSVGSWRGHERASRLSYLPQTLEVPLPFRVLELVEMGRAAGRHPQRLTCAEVLEMVGLTGKAELPLAEISGGERQRAFLAMTLAQGGSTLLLDEPLAGLDLRYQYELLALLRQLCQERGLTILLSLHDLMLARELDRLLVLRQGELLADGLPGELLQPELVCRTFDLDPTARWSVAGQAARD
ncbi:MAG: ABC transporter ATP-binding protein [Geobacter sp.]